MISDIIYFVFLTLLSVTDLRKRSIKNWQVIMFAIFILCQLLRANSELLIIFSGFLIVSLFLWVGFLFGFLGAADVKIISLSSLYNFYRYDSLWVFKTGLVTYFIDTVFWVIYFRNRAKTSPLLFSWFLANILFFFIK